MAKKVGDSFELDDWVTITTKHRGNCNDEMRSKDGKTVQITTVDRNSIKFEGSGIWDYNSANDHYRHATYLEIFNSYINGGLNKERVDIYLKRSGNVNTIDNYSQNYIYDDTKLKSYFKKTAFAGGQLYSDLIPEKEKIEKKKVFLKKDSVNPLSLFKYFPIYYNNMYGFYDEERKMCIFPLLMDKTKSYTLQKQLIIPNIDNSIKQCYSFKPISLFCKFKVKDYKTSSNLFKYSSQKSKLVGKIVDIHTIEFDVQNPKESGLTNTLYVESEFGNLRMVWEDIEVIYPNIKGYNAKKDKSLIKLTKKGELICINISIGEELVVCKTKNISNVDYKDVIKVKKIKPIGNNVFIYFKGKYNKHEKLDVSNIKNFKKLECNETSKSSSKKSIKEKPKPGFVERLIKKEVIEW